MECGYGYLPPISIFWTSEGEGGAIDEVEGAAEEAGARCKVQAPSGSTWATRGEEGGGDEGGNEGG